MESFEKGSERGGKMSCIDEFMQKQLQQIEHLDKVLKTIEELCQKRLQPLGKEVEEEEG